MRETGSRAKLSQICDPADVRFSENGVTWLAAAAFAGQSWLVHGFSTRKGGVSGAHAADVARPELNLGFTTGDSQENVRENRMRFVEAIAGDRNAPLITVRQIHSNRTVLTYPTGSPEEADGILTDRAGILLGIQTADCIPVLVADPVRHAVAAFHAGWRGTVERIVEHGVARLRAEFGSEPARLIAAIGPRIGACCYSVGEELRAEFDARFSYSAQLFTQVKDPAPTLYLDLVGANRRQLLDAGLVDGAISIIGGCTSCQPDLFYSHRALRGRAGRMMSVIGIR